jgi:hypothetical protein
MARDIHEEMLVGMPAMRMALGRHFKWYYHLTPKVNLPSIRRTGLEPKGDSAPPHPVVKHVGVSAIKRVCLNPLGADTVPAVVQPGPFVCLAVVNEDLPFRLSLDWSYDGAFGIANVLLADNPDLAATEIFVQSAKRWGSIVVYDPIPSRALRAYCHGYFPHDPAHWPELSAVQDDMLVVIDERQRGAAPRPANPLA